MARHYSTPRPTCAASAVRRRHGGAAGLVLPGHSHRLCHRERRLTPGDRRSAEWAMVILSAIASGLIGFLTGKAISTGARQPPGVTIARALVLPSPAD